MRLTSGVPLRIGAKTGNPMPLLRSLHRDVLASGFHML